MSVTYEKALELKKQMEPDYQQRHEEFRVLRDFWHGNHWEHVDSGNLAGIGDLYKDLRGSRKDMGPNIRLVHNLIQEVHVKYQTYLSPLPMIRVPADTDSNRGRDQATTRERFLYGCWGENEMNVVLNRIAWYLPLFGDCFVGIHPDFERNMPRIVLQSPERAFPIMDSMGGLGAVIFCWEVPESVAKRDYPNWTPPEKRRKLFGRGSDEATVEILEYSDKMEFHRWIDGREVNGVEHNFGFNLYEQVSFIHVPDEPWNHGAVEQALNLNLAEDALRSLLFEAVLQNVFPILHLEDPYKFPEVMELGPGGVIATHSGGKAGYITPPVQGLPVQMGFLADNERAIKMQTSMPDIQFGQINASIVTGKAINELQGAGTGSTIEMVQGVGIGPALSKWNSKAIVMAQRMFREEQIYLEGFYQESNYDINPKSFAFRKKGSEIVGSPRNEVVFSPYMNAHEKLVMALQAMGGGLITKHHAREQIGIPDSQAMADAIMGERLEDAVMEGIYQAFVAAGAPPDQAADAEAQALAYLQGASPSNFSPATPNPQAALPGAGGTELPLGPLAPGATGQAFSPAMQLPPGSPPPANMPQGGEPAPNAILLDEAIQAFQSVSNVGGRVFLVGEIVATGQTDDDIEVALTNPGDRQTLADGLPQYAGLLSFLHVEEEPSEQFIEVTPGAEPVQGGSEVDLEIEDEEELV